MKGETSKNYIQHLLSSALSELKFTSSLDKLDILVPEKGFGDYSTNAGLILAKKLKQKPAEICQKIIDVVLKLDEKKVFEKVEQKAGFINFTLSQNCLIENLAKILDEKDKYGSSQNNQDKTVLVEYFQNNVAKPPHVGHLRSAVVGDSLLRVFRFLGYRAVSDTHIGDWGTQFGVLILGFKTLGDRQMVEKDPINELNKLYVEMSVKIQERPELHEQAKAEFAKLEKGDAENRRLWQWFVMESLADFEHYRQLLGLLPFDHNLGESFYEDKMPGALKQLTDKGLVKTGETGEQYVDLEEFGLGRCILLKSDGATTYHMRDLATYIYRKKDFNFWKNIYVVDNRQAHHFRQLFKVLELAGYPSQTDSVHVELGFMSLPEGPISTRKGNIISLQNLIDEAEGRALLIIEQKNPDLQNKTEIAKIVAKASIKYFDLAHNRKTEFVFTWDKALSFEGNTGPYLQYTHARIHGIFRKAMAEFKNGEESVIENQLLEKLSDQDFTVLRKLIKFPEILEQVSIDLLPSLLCNYLFELAKLFNSFYQDTPILLDENGQRRAFRLNMIKAVAQVIENGLNLLGIQAPKEM